MKTLDIGLIPTSLGEVLNIKGHFDAQLKHQFDQIKLGFNTKLWNECLHTEASDWPEKEKGWHQLLHDLGQLFFSEPPYVVDNLMGFYGGDMGVLAKKFNLTPQKVELSNYLCKGKALDVGKYIVVTTKARQLSRRNFMPLSIDLWRVLRDLSAKYKIVILGERKVEMRKEYGAHPDGVFGIYEQLICNLPAENIVDLTVPALGETVSTLAQIQQDCLIMNEAEFVVTAGVGGNFCLSTSTAKMAIGFRDDKLEFTDAIYEGNKNYPNAIITKDWGRFIGALKAYL